MQRTRKPVLKMKFKKNAVHFTASDIAKIAKEAKAIALVEGGKYEDGREYIVVMIDDFDPLKI